MIKIAIFASGSGSNAENIVRYFSKHPSIQISLILTNKPDAFVLQRARELQIRSVVVSAKDVNEGETVPALLRDNEIDWIVLAGFLLKIPDVLIAAYPHRILNIHPALLPKFGGKGMYGRYVHEAVVSSGEKVSGITIHYVNGSYDEGQIIFQAECPVLPSDTADEVASKVHALEYEHYPRIIEQVVMSH